MARTGTTLFQYLVAVIFTALMVLLRWLLDPVLGDYVPFGLIYGAVAFSVWVGGLRAALLAAAIGYFATDYLLVEPRVPQRYDDPGVRVLTREPHAV